MEKQQIRGRDTLRRRWLDSPTVEALLSPPDQHRSQRYFFLVSAHPQVTEQARV